MCAPVVPATVASGHFEIVTNGLRSHRRGLTPQHNWQQPVFTPLWKSLDNRPPALEGCVHRQIRPPYFSHPLLEEDSATAL